MRGAASFVWLFLGLGVWCAPASGASPFADALASAGSAPVVTGSNGWYYLTSELRFLNHDRFWGEWGAAPDSVPARPRDPLSALVDFAQQIQTAGLHLLVVPVPPKALIYPEPLGVSLADARAADAVLDAFYLELKALGIAIVDLRPVFRTRRETQELYCRTDSHWSGAGLELAAQEVDGQLRAAGWNRAAATAWPVERREVEINGDLARMAGASTREKISLGFVTDEAGAAVKSDPVGPLLLLGDSHTLVFQAGGDMHAAGAGLPDHLARALGQPVDLLGVRGSGATTSRISLMRRARAQPDYLKNKRWVVWCLAARDFTEADSWRVVPLLP